MIIGVFYHNNDRYFRLDTKNITPFFFNLFSP